MARISSYENDTTVNDSDKFLGSNSGGQTKNFRLNDITKFLRATNGGGVGGQLVYLYHKNDFGGFSSRQAGTISVPGETNTLKAFSSISTLRFSKLANASNSDMSALLSTFVNENIIISDTENPSNFGIFNVDSVAQDGTETNFYNFTLTAVTNQSNGNIEDLRSYSINVFTAGDKNFITSNLAFTNEVRTHTVNHNLGKFPSVTIVDSAGTQVFGEIKHTNTNTLTVTFNSNFTAKIYAN